ncbi:MAG: AAC(3) family N-acetyltransferase [Pseudomonadota bacterium]
MICNIQTLQSLTADLRALGVEEGDGLFVHSSMKAIGETVGGPRMVVEALLSSVGSTGLIGMPGFSTDAYFPANIEPAMLSQAERAMIEDAVPGFDLHRSPSNEMGVIAETFRTWPGTKRSDHPAVSICLNGLNADGFLASHPLAWATGRDSPLGKLMERPSMKILLIGVGWNRCSPLHTAEELAEVRRTKIRRFKHGSAFGGWMETPDVADDLNRLFPSVGEAFEETGEVSLGRIGGAPSKLCNYGDLVRFASAWISRTNAESGDQH